MLRGMRHVAANVSLNSKLPPFLQRPAAPCCAACAMSRRTSVLRCGLPFRRARCSDSHAANATKPPRRNPSVHEKAGRRPICRTLCVLKGHPTLFRHLCVQGTATPAPSPRTLTKCTTPHVPAHRKCTAPNDKATALHVRSTAIASAGRRKSAREAVQARERAISGRRWSAGCGSGP